MSDILYDEADQPEAYDDKELELRAYGKRISFHTRHHWILTWLEEQPGKNLADRVWGVIDRAYRADYATRGRDALNECYRAIHEKNTKAAIDAVCQACEYYGRAGNKEGEDRARSLLYGLIERKAA